MSGLVMRRYAGFRGVDLRGDEAALSRSPDSENLWKDYRQSDAIRTRPSLEAVDSFPGAVYGIFFYTAAGVENCIVHAGTTLYRLTAGRREVLYQGVSPCRSQGFVYGDVWYFKDGTHYLCYDGKEAGPVTGFVPTTSIGRKPGGGGTALGDVNLLSPFRKNSFLADGKATVFHLDSRDIDAVTAVEVNGVAVSDYTVDTAAGTVTFSAAPSAPLTDGQDNVVITYKKEVPGYAHRILKCTLLTLFDNRVFFGGNPEYPNMLWHSSLNDPTYCSDLDYYNEGLDTARIRGMVAGNNALWVFREPSQANTTVFYHTPTLDAQYGKIYPASHASISTGCVGAATNFGDDIVFFSPRGMEGISGDIGSQQVIAHRSSMVDSRLTAMEGYDRMLLAQWEGYLLVFLGSRVFLADSRSAFSHNDHWEYDWFCWNLSKTVESVCVHKGVLYVGTAQGLFTLTGSGPVESWWVTAKDTFGAPAMQKTTNKRGCVAEGTGDVTVYAKTESSAFAPVGEFQKVEDYFVCRVKRKKFKDLQLKFHSFTRFSLEGVTMEAYTGGYIKR